tara:strand:- start:638 stop:1204 length:567 start_codon:yes stop_codon:yes gene_type:complete
MEEYSLFSSKVWSTKLNIEKEGLISRIKEFADENPSQRFSNVNGYQGHRFDDEELVNGIKNNVPETDEDLGELYVHTWVNINPKDAYNMRHTHTNGLVLLSGVYYVKVPENSGSIVFHDPRGPILHSMADQRYYNQASYSAIIPEEDKIFYFPSWLEHEVDVNNSDEERISISFNIIRKNDCDWKMYL